jgi:tRNA threonylcarbamoyladenosine biosynthesis protein TsaB
MIILGIDTSGYTNAVGIVDGKKVLADESIPARTDSLEQIVANIDDIFKKTGLKLEDVGGIGVGLGPGSWTGIRVGVTVGKILAFSSGKPVAGIPTLEALAYAAGETPRFICSVIDVGAGKSVYAGLYRFQGGELVKQDDYFVGTLNDLMSLLEKPCYLVGAEVSKYTGIISRNFSNDEVITIEKSPSGAMVAALAEKRLVKGSGDDVLPLTPLYLKESAAKTLVERYNDEKRYRGGGKIPLNPPFTKWETGRGRGYRGRV